jgi:TetR/AcrR family transcriptional regulator, tetracycline repressor protein
MHLLAWAAARAIYWVQCTQCRTSKHKFEAAIPPVSVPADSPPAGGPPQSRRGPAPRTSRRKLAQAALQLIDEEGLTALTMRRLAERAGLGTMSLYRYFADKEQLLAAALDLSAPQIELPEPDGEVWKSQLHALLVDLRRELAHYPSLARERFRLSATTEASLEISDRILAILRAAGFTAQEAVDSARSLVMLAVGFAATGDPNARQRIEQRTHERLRTVDREKYPTFFGLLDVMTSAPTDERVYVLALDALLDGLEMRLRRAGPGPA